MKKEYTPIAMRCNQEQFDKIIPKLKKAGLAYYESNSHYIYLTNNYNRSREVRFTNCNSDDYAERTTYNDWNEQIFLEACGIKTNNDMKLSKEFIKANADKTLKEVFPEAFKVDYDEPLLSLNDLLSVWCSDNDIESYKKSPLFKSFERLAEQKLKDK